MHRPAAGLLAAAAIVTLGTACGDDLVGGGLPDGPGRFDSPADFDQRGCTAGALGDLDPQAIYHLQADYGDGYVATTAVRFDTLGPGQFGGVIAGADAARAWADADTLFLYRPVGEAESRSLLLCDRVGDELHGAYAYCTATECFLAAVTARQVARLDEAPASGLTLLGELASPAWGDGITVNVRVADDLAYLARYQDGLRIVDVQDPTHPVDVGHGATEFPDQGEIYNDVKVLTVGATRYALMASSKVGVVVWDVTAPATPSIVAHFGTPAAMGGTPIHTLALDGGKAYLANTRRGLEIWDVANPAAPGFLGEFFPPGAPDGAFLHDLSVDGARAYLNFWNAGMVIADVSNPAQVRGVGTFADYGETSSHSNWVTTVGGRRIAAHGDEQWGSHLRLVDVTENSAGFLQQLGEWQTRPEVSAHNIMAVGSEVFLAHYQDGVRIVDIADPAAPRTAAWFNTWPGYDRTYGHSFFEGAVGIDLDLARGRIYVADSNRGLLILNRP